MKILVVEDDYYYSARLRESLEDHGYEVLCANSVEESLTLSFDEISAVVSDVMLPNDPDKTGITTEEARSGFLSGIALLRKLRKQGLRMPCLLLSGADTGGEAATWAANQGITYLSKESGPNGVLRALENLGLKGSPPPPIAFIVHGIGCPALTMSIEGLRERQFIAQRFGVLHSAKSRCRRWYGLPQKKWTRRAQLIVG